MSFVAIAVIGGIGTSVAGSIIGANAAGSAADKQSQSAANALSLQKTEFETQQTNLAPWLQAGSNALSAIEYGMGIGSNAAPATGTGGMTYGSLNQQQPAFSFGAADFQADPGYQFRLNQGMQALNRQQAASGKLMGGAGAKEAIQYGQGFASNEYSNAYNRALANYNTNFNTAQQNRANILNPLQNVATMGQNAVAGTNAAAQNYANQGSNLLTQQGNAQAAGIVGTANAIGTGISGTGNALMNAYTMNMMNPQNSTGYINSNDMWNSFSGTFGGN